MSELAKGLRRGFCVGCDLVLLWKSNPKLLLRKRQRPLQGYIARGEQPETIMIQRERGLIGSVGLASRSGQRKAAERVFQNPSGLS
jgi:hypothetical protein